MKKIRLFFVVASLLLVTAGLFAGKLRFVTGAIYASNGTTYFQLTNTITLLNLTTSPSGSQATITDGCGNVYGLYSFTAPSTYTALYFHGC